MNCDHEKGSPSYKIAQENNQWDLILPQEYENIIAIGVFLWSFITDVFLMSCLIDTVFLHKKHWLLQKNWEQPVWFNNGRMPT